MHDKISTSNWAFLNMGETQETFNVLIYLGDFLEHHDVYEGHSTHTCDQSRSYDRKFAILTLTYVVLELLSEN